MIQFYAPDIETSRQLPESDSGHVVRVLRLQEGDEIIVVDGRGHRYRCVILDAHPKHVAVDIIEKECVAKHWSQRIVLAVAPTKNIDRIEWLLEKCVEMGVDEIVLLECRRSERRKINEDRLRKIMVSAMKQSLKAELPQLTGMMTIKDFLKRGDLPAQRMVGYCSDEVERRSFSKEYRSGEDVVVMVGPEGDFAPEEIEAVIGGGFMPVTFGNCRLRTETAALYAVAAIHALET